MAGRSSRRHSLKKSALLLLLGLSSLLGLVFSSPAPRAHALTPASDLNFQARLLNAAGAVVPDGNYNIDFKIYNADSTTGTVGTCTGACLWEETRTGANVVPVTNGYFSVNLGSVTGFPAINWDQQLYLTMNIGGTGAPSWDGEMQNGGHSIALTSVPLAFRANQLAVAGTNEQVLQFANNTFGQATTISLPDPGASTATVCYQNASACGFAASTGSGNYIQNSTSIQSNANFAIQSASSSNVGGIIRGASGQTADLFQLQTNTPATVFRVGATGAVLAQNSADSSTAFQVQNAAGTTLLNVSTSGSSVSFNRLSAPGTVTPTLLSAPSISSITQSGTAGTTSYSYKVSAQMSSGYFTPVSAVNTTATGNATLTSTNKNNITWGSVAGALNYYVYRSASSGSPSTTGLIGITTGTTLSDTGLPVTQSTPSASTLSSGTTYFYKVTAVDNLGGETTGSTEISQAVSAANQGIGLTWQPNSGARGYRVYRGTSSGAENVYFNTNTNSFTDYGSGSTSGTMPTVNTSYATSITNSGNTQISIGSTGNAVGQLYIAGNQPGLVNVSTSGVAGTTNYVYQIVGVNAAGNVLPPPYAVGYTNSGNATLDASNFDTISWPSVAGAVSYNIYRSVGVVSGGLIGNTTSTTYNDTGAAATGSVPLGSAGSISTAGIQQVVVQNHYALIPTSSGSTAFQIFNVLDPSKPALVNSVSGNIANYLTAQNNYVYTVSSLGTMQIFDITNVFSPTLISTTSLVNGTGSSENGSAILISGRYAYVTTNGSNHLEVFDISNPSSPVLVSVKTLVQGGSYMAISGKYLYVAVNQNAMNVNVYDISNPANPTLVTTFLADFNAAPSGFYIQGHYLYLKPSASVVNSGIIQVVDISNPTKLVTAGEFSAAGASSGIGSTIFVQGRYAFVTVINGNPGAYNALQIYDISNPTQITLLSAQPLIHGSGQHGVYVSGRYAYVASNGALQTFDLGGEYAQNLEVGTAEINSVIVNNGASFGGDVSVQSGLSVTGAAQIGGDFGVAGNTDFQGAISVTGGVTGGLVINSLTTPSAPTVTPQGTTGAISYSYAITAISATGGETLASTVGSTATGNATLNNSNYNLITWSPVAGAASYKVYRTASAGAPSSIGLIGSISGTAFNDTGIAASGSTPTIDTTGNFTVNGSQTTLKSTTNNTTAFQVQNSSGTSILNVDSTNARIGVDVTYSAMSAPTQNNTSTSTTGGTLAADTYYYKITAIDGAGGETLPSVEKSQVTTGSTSTITLSWVPVTGASGYKIYRSALSGAGSGGEVYLTTTLGTVNGANLNYVDSGSATAGSVAPPASNNAYTSTNNTDSELQLSIGGLGTPSGQLYVSGTKPKFIGSVSTSSITGGSVGRIDGSKLYVVNSTTATLQILDISNPVSPQLLSTTSLTAPGSFALYGKYLYVSSSSQGLIRIYDVSNPASVSFVTVFSTANVPVKLNVQGSYLYVLDQQSLETFDLINPSAPTPKANLQTLHNSGSNSNMRLSGNYGYIISTDNSGVTSKLSVINVSKPATPTVVGQYSGSAQLFNLVVQGGYLFAKQGNDGINLFSFDVSNPASPQNIKSVADFDNGNGTNSIGMELQGRYLYVTLSSSTSYFEIFDVSNPRSPVLLTSNTIVQNGPLLGIKGRYAYIANYNTKSVETYDLGGTYTQQLEAGGIQTSALSVDGNSTLAGEANILGGLGVGQSLQVAGNTGLAGGLNVQGSSVLGGGLNQLATPGAPTVTPTGTTGAQRWDYTITAVNAYGGETLASSAGTTATGNATLTSGNYNHVTWSAVSGATSYKIYRTYTTGATSPTTTGLVGSTTTLSFDDTGLAAAGSAPTINTTGQLTITGSALFQNATNSGTAFQVQNSSGSSFLTVDTTSNDLVQIGSSTTDATAIGLVVDSYNNGTDPTGTNGEIYYNTNLNRFRCYQNGVWGDCSGSPSTPTLVQVYGYGASTSDSTIGLDSTRGGIVIKDNATPISVSLFSVQNSSGSKYLDVTSSAVTLGENTVGNATSTATTATTSGTGTNTTTVALTAVNSLANGDVIFIDNAGQDYFTRITAGGGTTSLTVDPAVTYENARTVTKYNVQYLGSDGTNFSGATRNQNSFYQGYFLGGVVTGAGSTVYSDANISSVGNLQINTASGVNVKGTNSTTAFQVQNAAGTNILNVDSTTLKVSLNQSNFYITDLLAPATPGVAAGANTGGTLSGAAGTTYYYKITALNAAGESLSSSEVSINGQSFTKLSTAGAPTAALGAAGNVTGTYTYRVTFVTANGETTVGTTSSAVSPSAQQVNLTAIPTGATGTTGRNVYRCDNTGANCLRMSAGTTLANNTTTTLTDNTASYTGNPAPPGASTATTSTNNATVSWTAVTGATSYRIYRGTSAGGESAYQTSASSPFTDTGAAGTAASVPTRSMVAQLGIGTSSPSANLDVEGTALFKIGQDSTTAFQVQNAAGANVINVDTTASLNLINNGGFTAGVSGWVLKNGATITQSSSQSWQGSDSLSVATTTTANGGAYFSYTMLPGTQYTLSLYAKVGSGTISDFVIGDQDMSGTDINCSAGQTLTTSWQRFSCTFTTGATITNSNIYVQKSGGSAETFYIDGVQLQTGSVATAFNAGAGIQLNGVINSPVALQNKSDSNNAFSVQNASGSSILNIDTINQQVSIRGSSSTYPTLSVVGGGSCSTLDFESGTLCPFTTSSPAWTASTTEAHGGTYSGRSGAIGNSASTSISLTRTLSASGTVTYWAYQSSEACCDMTRFYIDGVLKQTISNNPSWVQFSSAITSGTHTLTWTYSKDGSSSGGLDAGFIDDVSVTNDITSPLNTIATFTNGNVGIGTSAPTSTLTVAGTSLVKTDSTNAFQVQTSTGTNLLNIDTTNLANNFTANTYVKPPTNSATAFQVQNNSSTGVFTVDTTTNGVKVNQGNLTITGLTNPSTPALSTSSTGGTLAAATYYYMLAAVNANGTTLAVASNPTSATTTGSTSQNTLTWTAVTNAASYNVYRSTDGTTWKVNNVSSATLSIVDNGSNYTWTTSGAIPTTNTTGGNLTVNGSTTFANSTNSSNALDVQDATGDSILRIDSTDRFIGINNSAPVATLDVAASPPAPDFSFGFEDGTYGAFSHTGTQSLAGGYAHTGSYGWGGNSSTSGTMTLSRTLASAGTISFWAATYSFWGGNCNFTIDAVCKLVDSSGFHSYAFYSYPVTAGTHTFFWNASPDTAGYMYLDDVTVGVSASNPTAAVFHGGNVGIGTTAPSATLEVDGNSIFKAPANVTSTLQVQNATGDSLLNADTTNSQITIGRFVDSSLSAPASPGAAAGSNQGGTLSGAGGTTYYYKVSAMTVDGETPLSSEVSINGASFTPLTAPAALTVGTPSAGGSVDLGLHSYKVTFVTANGETTGGTTSAQVNVTTGGTQTVPLTAIPTGPTGTTSRKVYRTVAGDTGSYLLVTTIANNTATTYNDTTADASLGAAAPGSNTATTNTNNATISWSAVTGATGYRVYRATASGAQTSYQTAASSPFTDTGAAGTSLTNSSLAVKGTTSIQNLVDSTTAFQIQNASGTSLFTIDTANSKISLGSASSTPVILVLGIKNTSGDPTCTTGGIYYNSNSNQFRGCQNSSWIGFNPVPQYVTSLPGSPYDGQEIYYNVGSGTVWHLRYNSSSTYWEFLGGTPLVVTVSTEENAGSTGSWINLTTGGPSYTTPFAGDWHISYSATGVNSAGSVQAEDIGVAVGDTTPSLITNSNQFSGSRTTIYGDGEITGVSSGSVIKLRYKSDSSTSTAYSQRQITIYPIRVQ